VISKDESIITQVVAKIASELTGATQTGGSQEEIQAVYLSHFDFVREVVFGAHNISATPAVTVTNATSAPVTEAEIMSAFNAAYALNGQANTPPTGGLVIKGTQHGPIPSWLVAQASKAGVTAVFDNRDTATAENRRPMFKAADGTTDKNGKPLAFWPPR
jgi:hypothetical protein